MLHYKYFSSLFLFCFVFQTNLLHFYSVSPSIYLSLAHRNANKNQINYLLCCVNFCNINEINKYVSCCCCVFFCCSCSCQEEEQRISTQFFCFFFFFCSNSNLQCFRINRMNKYMWILNDY